MKQDETKYTIVETPNRVLTDGDNFQWLLLTKNQSELLLEDGEIEIWGLSVVNDMLFNRSICDSKLDNENINDPFDFYGVELGYQILESFCKSCSNLEKSDKDCKECGVYDSTTGEL